MFASLSVIVLVPRGVNCLVHVFGPVLRLALGLAICSAIVDTLFSLLSFYVFLLELLSGFVMLLVYWVVLLVVDVGSWFRCLW